MKNYLTMALAMLISIATGALTTSCNSDNDEVHQYQIWLDNRVPASIPADYTIISGELRWRYGDDATKVSTITLPYNTDKGLTCSEGTYYVEGTMLVSFDDAGGRAVDQPGGTTRVEALRTSGYVKVSGPGSVPITWTE